MPVPALDRRAFLAATATAGLAAPRPARAQMPPKLRICGWGGNWDEMFKADIVPAFEAAHGCEVEIDTGWPFMPKLLSSSPRRPFYDVLLANPHDHWKAFDAGFVEDTPDATRVPNLADVYAYAKRDELVGVTFLNSAVGLAYRKDLVAAPPTSWLAIFEDAYKGRRGSYVMQNTLGAGFFLMTGKLFGSGFTDTDAMFAATERLKPVKLVDFTGAMEKLLRSGEVAIGVINDADTLRYEGVDDTLAFLNPAEGSIALEQTYSVAKGSEVRELAYAWIDFLLAPANQKLICEKLWMSPVNRKTDLAPKYLDKLYITEEKVKTLITPDWNWFNRNFDRLNNTYMRILAA